MWSCVEQLGWLHGCSQVILKLAGVGESTPNRLLTSPPCHWFLAPRAGLTVSIRHCCWLLFLARNIPLSWASQNLVRLEWVEYSSVELCVVDTTQCGSVTLLFPHLADYRHYLDTICQYLTSSWSLYRSQVIPCSYQNSLQFRQHVWEFIFMNLLNLCFLDFFFNLLMYLFYYVHFFFLWQCEFYPFLVSYWHNSG